MRNRAKTGKYDKPMPEQIIQTLEIEMKAGPLGEMIDIAGERLRERFPLLLAKDKMVNGYHVVIATARLAYMQQENGIVRLYYEIVEGG